MLVETTDSRGGLQCGAYHCGIGRQLDFWSTLSEIPSQESRCPVSSGCYSFNIGGPGEVSGDGDGDARVLAGTCCFQRFPVEKGVGCQDFSLLVGHTADDVAFACFICQACPPLSERVHVFLK